MSKRLDNAAIVSHEEISKDIFSLTLKTEIAKDALPGQFVSVYLPNDAKLLPRPISISYIDKENGTITLVYRLAGEGTRELSCLLAGEIRILGPLGNGFPTTRIENERLMVIGGGIGIAPMRAVALAHPGCKVVLGYRDADTFLIDDFRKAGEVHISSDNGTVGVKGTVIDAIKADEITADIIFACGPAPMLRGIKEYAKEHDILCYVSLEERMACGVGACLACTCGSTQKDSHSNVNNKRVCADGPVFLAEEVTL